MVTAKRNLTDVLRVTGKRAVPPHRDTSRPVSPHRPVDKSERIDGPVVAFVKKHAS